MTEPLDPAEPWIETRAGTWFFANALMFAPAFVVLVPMTARIVLEALGVLTGPALIIDTIPIIARWVVPFVGWLTVIPIWTTVRNLRMGVTGLPRVLLLLFLVTHLGFLGVTIWFWTAGGVRPT